MLGFLILQLLCNLLRCHRAVTDKMRGVRLLHFAHDRPWNFFGNGVEFFLDSVSAIGSGAAFDRFDLRIGRERE